MFTLDTMPSSSKLTTASSNLHSFTLDLNSPISRRRAQRRVAQRIAQRRMLQQNPNEIAEDGSSVVHRTGIHHGDYEGLSSYTQVEFLNDHDVVLAGYQDACIDIVKLPRYQAPDEEKQTQTCRPMGKLLARKVVSAYYSSGPGPVQGLKGLDSGNSFVVGHQGQFFVYATEHASLLKESETLSVSQQRIPDTPKLELRCSRLLQCKNSFTTGEDYAYYIMTIESMLESFGLRQDGLTLRDIYNYPGKPANVFANPRYEYMWDFRETPSTIMASFLVREKNSFSISILDARMSHKVNESVSYIRPDSEGVPQKFNPNVGHVTSTCFVSDHCLATLHMWQQPSREYSSTVVKLWDIRNTSRNKSTPVVESVLSPTLYDVSGNVETNVTMNLNNQVRWENSSSQARLVSSIDDNGLIMANIVTNNDVGESYVLDASRGTVVKQYRTRSAVQSTNAVAPTLDCLACYDSSSLSLYDFSKHDRQKKCEISMTGNRNSRGKKRSQDEVSSLSTSSEALDDEDCLIGTVAPTIEDEEGIRARLSCLAFNKTGTSLVGGTDAGDLFLWRGG